MDEHVENWTFQMSSTENSTMEKGVKFLKQLNLYLTCNLSSYQREILKMCLKRKNTWSVLSIAMLLIITKICN